MSETLRQMEDKLLLLRTATNSRGQRIVETADHVYKRAVHDLSVQVEEQRRAESGPRINATWLRTTDKSPGGYAPLSPPLAKDLEFLNSISASKNPRTGKRYVEEHPAIRASIEKARVGLFEGRPVSEAMRSDTLAAIDKANVDHTRLVSAKAEIAKLEGTK
jgi:hypothetical protein